MADVTIKLTGEQYRTLVIELAYHYDALKSDPMKRLKNTDGHAFRERVIRLHDLREVID